MTVDIADAHAHVERLVSVVKMATVIEVFTTEEHRSFVRFFFCWQKDSMQSIFIKKYFLFNMGSVCRVKRSTTGLQTFRWWRRGWNGGAEVAETTVKRHLCCGFRRTGKAMGQMYQCWWRICREISGFSRFEYHMFYVSYPFVTYLQTFPHNYASRRENIWMSGGIAPPFSSLGTRGRWAVNFSSLPFYPWGNSPGTHQILGWWSGYGAEKIYFNCPVV
jgi:hypothetical protein